MSSEPIGVADAKRRFSELFDRVRDGERIVISRRGRAAAVLVPPDDGESAGARAAPAGFAALAGTLADWDELDTVVEEVLSSRAQVLRCATRWTYRFGSCATTQPG